MYLEDFKILFTNSPKNKTALFKKVLFCEELPIFKPYYEHWADDDSEKRAINNMMKEHPTSRFGGNYLRLHNLLKQNGNFIEWRDYIEKNVLSDIPAQILQNFLEEQLYNLYEGMEIGSPFETTLRLLYKKQNQQIAHVKATLFAILILYAMVGNEYFHKNYAWVYDIRQPEALKIYEGIFTLEEFYSSLERYPQTTNEVQCDSIPLTTNELFEEVLSDNLELGKITAIDMCFHGGSPWRTDTTKKRLLIKAINNGAMIRVIVNITEQVKEICPHMRESDLNYLGFEKNLKNWVELMMKYPESVEVRIATVPLFRRSYIIKGENSKGLANITYYAYGHVIEDCQRVNYRSGSNEYKLYANEFEYIWNHASVVYSEELLMSFKPKKNNGFDESDENNMAFVRKALKNQNCKSLDIISVLAYYCATGQIKELIESRLNDNSDFVLRMILPNKKNSKNLEKWFVNFDKKLMSIFNIFELWAKKYPNKFWLHYTDLPITDRIYINKTEEKMLVEHLSIPRSTNQALQEEYSKASTPQLYAAFEEQFERIWNDFSDSFIYKEKC